MAATTGATLSGVAFPLRHAGVGPFISTAGNVYWFGRDSVNTGQVEPHKASDPMTSFTAQTLKTMSSATSTAIEAMACYQVGQVIHVATQIATGAVYYNSYTMDTDTWSLTTSETAVAAAGFAPTTGFTFVSIGVRSGGNPVIAYCAGLTAMSSGFNMWRYRERTGVNTYSTATNVDLGGSVNWLGGPVGVGASGRVHFFFNDATNGRYYQRAMTSANVLQTLTGGTSQFDSLTGSVINGSHAISYVSGGSTVVVHGYESSRASNQHEAVARITSADAPTPAMETIASVSPFSSGNQLTNTLAVDGSTLHYLYVDPTSRDLIHHQDAGSGAWDGGTSELAGTLIHHTSNVYTRSGTKYLALVIDDAGTVNYAEITLSAPASYLFDQRLQTMRPLQLR